MKLHTVLFIDDDPDDHFILSEAASERKTDIEFLFYFSAKTALDDLDNARVKPDLIVLDINMPIMNGVQFLQQIAKRLHLKQIPIVVHSTGRDERMSKQCTDLGAVLYIEKGQSCTPLFEALDSLLVKVR